MKYDTIDYVMDRIHKAKFCRDCRWLVDVEQQGASGPYSKEYCVHGVRTEVNYVDGQIDFIDTLKNANVERHNPNLCGAAAKNYERKWWKLWRPK